MEVKNPHSLFDACVELLIGSLDMSGQASQHLPKKLTQYLLFLAMQRLRQGVLNSDFIVHKIIEKWPHEEISFDFKSNVLVRTRPRNDTELITRCLEPQEYYDLRGLFKSRLTRYAKDVAVGLFNHVYHGDREGTVSLRTVDLSDVQLSSAGSWDSGAPRVRERWTQRERDGMKAAGGMWGG